MLHTRESNSTHLCKNNNSQEFVHVLHKFINFFMILARWITTNKPVYLSKIVFSLHTAMIWAMPHPYLPLLYSNGRVLIFVQKQSF